MRIGILGGSFNPPHLGHLSLAQAVVKRLNLDRLLIIPSYQSPLKKDLGHLQVSPEDRLAMVKLMFDPLGAPFEVSPVEVQRAGVSYTIDTVRELKKQLGQDHEYFLILGVDNLPTLNLWKNWEDLLLEVSIVFTSRAGWHLPFELEDWPEFLRNKIKSIAFNEVELVEGRPIFLLSVPDVPVSSTEIRRKFQQGRTSIEGIALEVENYAKKKNLYPVAKPEFETPEELLQEMASLLLDRKLFNLTVLDVRGQSELVDFVIIASGTSGRHVSQSAEFFMVELKKRHGLRPVAYEGLTEGQWVVMDYGMVMVHIFVEKVRYVYALEDLLRGSRDLTTEIVTPLMKITEGR